ncbi:hypothetical protein QVD17_23070 [Tagetes erecta]|uniref:Uncharacterized protein n=1 Tax=Tagetes erecta TaxID=13708 RepID=A0AAD8KDP1_TARER|nr:hypothetical protein QVD17_23070 [Tagetes erecta]
MPAENPAVFLSHFAFDPLQIQKDVPGLLDICNTSKVYTQVTRVPTLRSPSFFLSFFLSYQQNLAFFSFVRTHEFNLKQSFDLH